MDGGKNLSPGERAFVEKYLGLDALEALPRVDPEPLREAAVPAPIIKTRLAEAEVKILPEIVVAPPRLETPVKTEEKVEQPQIVIAPPVNKVIEEEKQSAITEVVQESLTTAEEEIEQPELVKTELLEQPSITLEPASPPPSAAVELQNASAPVELSLKESMRKLPEVQVVSFFINGQLFLLPVEGIQEVLRHMELIRIPQAPPFVAGVINLRGKVTPLVHLSAILTNMTEYNYDPDKNFIIICGTEPLQVGLIIDRINSMHMLSQDKIIWNPESKLGDAADFLYAIVDLDEKVCGMVAPELITKKILSSDS